MNFISFNSKPDGVDTTKNCKYTEASIVTRTKEIVGNDTFRHIPINFFRSVSDIDYGRSLQKMVASVEKVNKYQKYLSLGQKEIKQKIASDTADVSERQDLRFVKEFQEFQKDSEQASSWLELQENKHARIAAQIIASASVGKEENKELFPPVMVACKSGKDRTGYVSWLADADIIKLHRSHINRKSLYNNGLARAGHIQYLAACNGGLPGRFGFKPVATDRLWASFKNFEDDALVEKVHKKLFRDPARHAHNMYRNLLKIPTTGVLYCSFVRLL